MQMRSGETLVSLIACCLYPFFYIVTIKRIDFFMLFKYYYFIIQSSISMTHIVP